MSSREYEVLVVGSGPAGYWASLIARMKGLKVALVEERKVGGTCLNYACVPLVVTSNYLSAVNLVRKLSEEGAGIFLSGVKVDISKLFKYVEENVSTPISEGMKRVLEDLGVDVIYGKALLVNEHKAKVDGESISFKNAVISTGLQWGAVSGAIPCVDFSKVEDVPSRVLVIGANSFGLSVAGFFGMLGSEVLVVEETSNILSGFDREVCEYLTTILGDYNIELMLNTKLGVVESREDGKEVTLSTAEGILRKNVDLVVDAVSYKPRLDVLAGVNVKLTDSGYVWVDEYLRTSLNNVYAAGDVTGLSLYASAAIVQGIIAGENVAGGNVKVSLKALPKYVLTPPEVFSVGLSESEARSEGYDVVVARQSLTSNAIAKSVGGAGMVKVVVDSKYGGILGVHAVGHKVTEILNEGIVAVALESTSEAIINSYLAHPTIGELLRDSLLQVFKP
ncbi:MAG: NAD(P)/FAD-dependent oxidoreductase [Sulfolobales archaeon]